MVGQSDRRTAWAGGLADGGPEYSMPARPDLNLNAQLALSARGRPGPPVNDQADYSERVERQ
jgi:hypothetical protein